MKTINLLTHSGQFHADDIFSTALLNIYYRHKDKTIKVKYKRSVKKEDIEKADIVYDIGLVYNPKKLRFDHHQNDTGLIRDNGIPYAAFGLVFKHFGPELISIISKEKNKKVIAEIFDIVEKKLVYHIDAMDNGTLTYKQLFKGVDIVTIDNYFKMCKFAAGVDDMKKIDKKFFELVKFSEPILENIIMYAVGIQKEKALAVRLYDRAKDKRVIICDRFYSFNFNKFIEPLLVVYPDLRGGWTAKNVQTGEDPYDARFYFPESWRGLVDEELKKVTGINGAKFCHKSGFLCVNETKEGLFKMIDLALIN